MAISKWQLANGFTLIELIVVMGIFATLAGITTISLLNAQHKSMLGAVTSTFVADLKAQQLRAMVGDTGGSANAANYGVRLQDGSYTLFTDTYGTSNFVIDMPDVIEFTAPDYQMIFLKGSGEMLGGPGSVTIRDTQDGSQKTININKYGIVTGIN